MKKVNEYIKCPRCELNYIIKKDKFCDVCKSEMKAGILEENDFDELEEGLDLCPICKVNYITDIYECFTDDIEDCIILVSGSGKRMFLKMSNIAAHEDKLVEFKEIFSQAAEAQTQVMSLKDAVRIYAGDAAEYGDPEETGKTFAANAYLKAAALYEFLGKALQELTQHFPLP